MRAAIDAMREAFGQLARGEVDMPLRAAVEIPEQDAVTLVMPGRARVQYGLGAKLVSVFPTNPGAGLPLIHSAVILLDPQTGRVAALLEGGALTAIRTGATSGLATDLLARAGAASVAIVGAGVQARTQLEAVCCVRPIEHVWVYSRSREESERFAVEMEEKLDVPDGIRVASSAGEAVGNADVVCTATTSSSPVLRSGQISSGTHINAVGSFTREMRELDPALLAGAYVVVDQREAALAEAGEVIAAVVEGLLSESALVELGAIVNGDAPGRTSDEQITVFKSVGLAVQDLVAGASAVGRAEREGLGSLIAF